MKTKASPVKRHKKATARVKPVVLPDDACPSCGTMMIERRASLRYPVNGERVAVPLVTHLRCPKCAQKMFRYDDAKQFHRDAIAIYRKKYGLLSADELRALREQLGLTQAELARLLHLGANTISRWEAGRNVQTEAMEMLLRIIRDVPGSLDYLRSHAA
jgi:putative zinc finger/helix-turn-helix YgiT family protein